MKHSQEINAVQEKISQLKVIINNMQNQIKTLGQELLMSQKTNIEEVFKVAVSILDSSRSSVKSGTEQTENYIIEFDHCTFRCENDELMVTPVRKDHEECQYCYFCGEYFGTEFFLQDHNRQ